MKKASSTVLRDHQCKVARDNARFFRGMFTCLRYQPSSSRTLLLVLNFTNDEKRPVREPKNKTPPISGVLSAKRQAYSACATSVPLWLRLHCGSSVPISIPAMLNSRPASCGGQKAASLQVYSR